MNELWLDGILYWQVNGVWIDSFDGNPVGKEMVKILNEMGE